MTPRRPLLAALLLAGCASQDRRVPSVPVPSSLQRGAGDPATAAIHVTAYVFGQPQSVAGKPADAADSIAQLEWLVDNLATDQRWIPMPALVLPNMRAGRDEVRRAFGVPLDLSTTDAVQGFDAAAQALRSFDLVGAGESLGAMVGEDRVGRALDLLANLPRFPRAAFATAEAQRGANEMNRRATMDD